MRKEPRAQSANKIILSPLALLVLAACGSGGGGGSVSAPATFTRSGAVVKGPLKDALAFLDYDDDGVRDLISNGDARDEPAVRTGADGSYTITGSIANQNATLVAITDSSTVDASSGTILDGLTLSAPASATVISIASTLMVNSEKSGTPLTEAEVKEALGITGTGSEDIDLLTYNPFVVGSSATSEQKQLAASVEVASQQVSAVVSTLTAAAKASGIAEADAFAESLKAVSTFVKEQSDASVTVDLTNSTQLTAVADKVSTAVAAKAVADPSLGVDTVAFDNMKTTVVTAVQNVNTVIKENVNETNFSADAAKSIYSVSQVLVDQVAEAVSAEVVTKGTGSTSITYSNRATVDTASLNAAPTDIDLVVNGSTLPENSPAKIVENANSLLIGTLAVNDDTDQSFTFSLGGDDANSFTISDSALYLKTQPNYEAKSSYSVSISAKDSGGKSFAETFTVNVEDVDEAAENITLSKVTLNEDEAGATVGIVSATDPEGNAVTFSVDQTKDDGIYFEIKTIGGTQILKLKDAYAANFENLTSYSVTINADDADDGLNISEKKFTLSVVDINDKPILVNTVSDQTVAEDDALTFQFSADVFADADAGDTLSYSASLTNGSNLPPWLIFDPSSRTFSGTPLNTDVGSYEVNLKATDAGLSSVSDVFKIDVINTNDPPTLSGLEAVTVSEDTVYSYNFSVSDIDVGDSITLTTPTKPAWLTLDTVSKTLSGVPTNEFVGDNAVVILATDEAGATATKSLTISVTNTNDAPTVTSTAVTAVNEDAAYSYTFVASDMDIGDSVTLAAPTLPSWLSFDASTGVLSGTPTNTEVGDHSVVLTATDQSSAVTTHAFTVNVNSIPTVANPISDQTATEDIAFSLQFSSDVFQDSDSTGSMTYSVTSSWLSFDPTTRTFSGTPVNDNVGAQDITVTASDGIGSVEDVFRVTVNNTNDAPRFTSQPIQSVNEDSRYSYFIVVSDEDVGDRANFTSISKPDWLYYNPILRSLEGTPENSDVGNHAVSVTFTDNNNASTQQDFVISVDNVNDAPTVTNPTPDQTFQAGQAGSFNYAADAFNDVDVGDTLTISAKLASGAELPSWLTFNAADRTISGTPGNSDLDTLEIILIATDQNGLSVEDQFSLDISHNPVALVTETDVQIQKGSIFSVSTGDKFSDADGASDIVSYDATLKGGADLPSWLNINTKTGQLTGIAPSVDVRENPRTFNLDAYDSSTDTYSSAENLRYETTYVTVTATDSAGLIANTEIQLNPKGLAEVDTSSITLKDYKNGTQETTYSLSGTTDYRENEGNVLTLSSFSLDNANLQLVKDSSTSTWPKSPEILLSIIDIQANSSFGSIGEVSIFLGEAKSITGTNYRTVESGEKYVELRFSASANTDSTGALSFTYVPRLEGDVKYNINSNPLLATTSVNENETLQFVAGSSATNAELKISVLDLLDQLPFASSIGNLLPFAPGDFYVKIDGLPLQTASGDYIDVIDAQFSIV